MSGPSVASVPSWRPISRIQVVGGPSSRDSEMIFRFRPARSLGWGLGEGAVAAADAAREQHRSGRDAVEELALPIRQADRVAPSGNIEQLRSTSRSMTTSSSPLTMGRKVSPKGSPRPAGSAPRAGLAKTCAGARSWLLPRGARTAVIGPYADFGPFIEARSGLSQAPAARYGLDRRVRQQHRRCGPRARQRSKSRAWRGCWPRAARAAKGPMSDAWHRAAARRRRDRRQRVAQRRPVQRHDRCRARRARQPAPGPIE